MKGSTNPSVGSRDRDLWPIKKALTSSDVDITHPFLTLPRQPVEDHILVHLTPQERDHLKNVEHVIINAQDDDTGETYEMKLKWRGSYFNLIGKWGKIVREKGLHARREIRLRWANGCLHFSSPEPEIAVPQEHIKIAAQDEDEQQWPIKKLLTLSDVDTNHPFLPLPRRLVEDHILMHLTLQEREQLSNEEQVAVNAVDRDTGEIYLMKLKWRGNYYNLIGKWGKIVRRKGLDVGKEIKICWADKCLNFSVSQEQKVTFPALLDRWPIRKTLTLSDVDINHPFLTLAGKAVEEHILVHWDEQAREKLRNEKQVNISAQDSDNGDLYAMKLRWRGSYFNLIGKWGQIVRGKRLCVGKEIRVSWSNGCLLFSVPP